MLMIGKNLALKVVELLRNWKSLKIGKLLAMDLVEGKFWNFFFEKKETQNSRQLFAFEIRQLVAYYTYYYISISISV
jgi:hypothetical protein